MKKIATILKRIFLTEHWNIAIRRKGTGSILTDKKTKWKVYNNPINLWAADPFIYKFGCKTFIFAEILEYKTRKGYIAYAVLDEKNMTISKWKPAIIEEHHLSFPYIFEEDNDVYIIPESNKANCLSKYRAVSFPENFQRENIYFGDRLADTVLFFYNGKEYGYSLKNPASNENDCSILFEYKKDRIRVINDSVSTDKDTYRNGGKFFVYRNNLIRVIQNCSGAYGKELIFSIIDLDNNKVIEKEIDRVSPSDLTLNKRKRWEGCHTYNSNEDYEIIDLKSYCFNIIEFAYRIIRKMGFQKNK